VGVNQTSALVDINLAHNRLEKIYKSAFIKTPALQWLNLSHNRIETIKSKALSDLVELITLDLSHNKLRILDQKCFKKLKNLKTLNIAHNLITSLEPDILHNNSKLQHLDLSHNQLEICSDVCPLKLMLSLDVSHNSDMDLTTNQCWPDYMQELALDGIGFEELQIQNLENLLYLSIQDNQMASFDFGNSTNYFRNLRYIRIANNTWECSYLELILVMFRMQYTIILDTTKESGPNMVEGITCASFKTKTYKSSRRFGIVTNAAVISGVITVVACFLFSVIEIKFVVELLKPLLQGNNRVSR
jgi:Leucine-rich repeat (LRR) protein